MSLLTLRLKRVPNVLGIYGKTKDQFPASMAFLHPDAAAAYEAACKVVGRLRVSDMLRTAEASLQAMQTKAGVQPPGFSAHNYGLAIDIDTDAMLTATKLDKKALDAKMASCGWCCHRKDGRRGMEDWHYNFLGVGKDAAAFLAVCEGKSSTALAIEAKIAAIHGDDLTLDPYEAQTALAKLGLYGGAIDGDLGPRTKQGIAAFQRAWKLKESGTLDARTERTLALVSANKLVME